MCDFVPTEVRPYVPYDWEEYLSVVVGTYGLLAHSQSVAERAMRLEGACVAREKIARAVLREFVTMTYAAGAGQLELDVHVRVCWVAKTGVDRILMEEHEAAEWRIHLFRKKIKLLHADRAGMRRVLKVIKPVIKECATYVKEKSPAKCYAVRAGLNGKKVPWHEDDWGFMMSDSTAMSTRAFSNPPSIMTSTNKPQWRRMQQPAANGHGNARSLAGFYSGLLDGRLLESELLDELTREQGVGEDKTLLTRTRFGLGCMLDQPEVANATYGMGARAFGHPGAGGSCGFADPERDVAFGFVVNNLGPFVLMDPRAQKLAHVLADCL
jgi:hypothetical protein